MITDAILGFFGLIGDALIGLVGLIGVPDAEQAMGSLFTDLGVITQSMADMGTWIPWPVAGAVIIVLWIVFQAVITIRLLRVLISLITGGGGSAG